MNGGWTDEQDTQAAKLWNEGRTATEVGRAIGKSRNAVIGRVHR